ncbi:hypothetical protein AGRO_3949 [Agrobacterium sp. ATCC 31749]|nr:hypothetical protein AGRO_3949 [Agrobacterium sp. ATCC 31749]KJX88929.1 hypothetical protein SY94_1001 [Agrobacterium tumefaciens]CUX20019.1 conserved hypothetical protein [Agrobacterium fabrum str. J-07]CUX51814.1 conserved hypothetical protein [Agrobacterium sp. NCPPB 925]
MINYNFLYAFCDIAHVGFLDLYFERECLSAPCPVRSPHAPFKSGTAGKPVQPGPS